LWEEYGMALPNMGHISGQTIAGACSTGTHGKTGNHACISEIVTVWRIVTAERGVIEIHTNNGKPELKGENIAGLNASDMYSAFGVSLGLLGIISTLTIQIVPKFCLLSKCVIHNFADAVAEIDTLWEKNAWADVEYFTSTGRVIFETVNFIDKGKSVADIVAENKSVKFTDGPIRAQLLSEVRLVDESLTVASKFFHERTPDSLLKLEELLVVKTGLPYPVVGRSYESIAQNDGLDLKHYEMDLAVPFEHVTQVFAKIHEYFTTSKNFRFMPIDFRCTKADNFWMSCAYNRKTLWICFLEYRQMDEKVIKQFYDDMRKIVSPYNYRSHWGKVMRDDVSHVQTVFPKLHEFLKLRKELDPQGIFLNPYFAELIGIAI